MELGGTPDLGHLTYCTNIHAAEAWPDVLAGLQRHLPAIKAAVAPDQPLGVGLRLAAAAAESLRDPAAFAALEELLQSGGCYVFTLNGFPYGAFHGTRVKEGAYAPDWAEPVRLSYTNLLADHLVRLLPAGQVGSISTVPGTFKPWAAEDPGRIDAIADHLLQHVAHLVALRAQSGKTLVLALEPEPCCLLETIAETVAFFEDRLFSQAAVDRVAALSGLSASDSEAALRRHLGVCYDVCHAAVEFEAPRASVSCLQSAGIAIAKLQLSAALKIPAVGPETAAQLAPFDEPTYLHQVVARCDGILTRYSDLPEALAALDDSQGAEWRSHFHVPIFLDHLQDFDTTQDFLREILGFHRESPISPHLEVETYTWDVLPERYRNASVSAAIARELNWVKGQLNP